MPARGTAPVAARYESIFRRQPLVSVIALGRMFTRYSRSYLMEDIGALILVLFVFSLGPSALIGAIEKRIGYCAGVRGRAGIGGARAAQST